MEAAFPMEDPALCEKFYPRQARTPFNVTGNPALAVPIGFNEEGLPLSMQVVTPQFDETMAYRIAASFESETEWTRHHPNLDETSAY